MYASDLLSETETPCVYRAPSLIHPGGQGLFSRYKIAKGRPVVVYYGTLLTHQEIYELYRSDSEQYYQLSDDLRGTLNGQVVCGDREVTNPNYQGIWVNDISSLSDEINIDRYLETLQLCNLKVVETLDYPVYIATRQIKKNEELTVHYGPGYWLSHLHMTPEEISDLDQKYHFMK
jgi:hypothetical protein